MFYLDGAHSPESMEICARWFSLSVQPPGTSGSSHDPVQRHPVEKVGKKSEQVDALFYKPWRSSFSLAVTEKNLLINTCRYCCLIVCQ